MNYKDFQTYIDLINYIRDLTLENRDKKDLLSLVKELCDEVEETAFNEAKKVALAERRGKDYEQGHKDGYNDGHVDGYCAGYDEGWNDDCVLKKKKIVGGCD